MKIDPVESGAHDDVLRLAFVGDICLGGGLQTDLRKRGPVYPFEAASAAFDGCDVVIGNLECCILDKVGDDAPDPAPNIMAVPAELAGGLTTAGIGVVALCNNHILDAGGVGLDSTCRFLAQHGIQHFGAGQDLREAERPLILERKGLRLAFLGACDAPTVFAGPHRPGVPPMHLRRLLRRVKEARKGADVVVVALHADLEFSSFPSMNRVRLSRALVAQGANLVIQHHPHVCQGVETLGGALIAYSLGNFVFRVHGNTYFHEHADTAWGLVLRVTLQRVNGQIVIAHDCLPVTIDAGNKTKLSTGAERQRQLALLANYSAGLAQWRVLRRARMQRCLREARMNVFGLYYLWRRKGAAAALRSLYDTIRSPYERRWMYSLCSFGYLG